jgi:hypothetical protein
MQGKLNYMLGVQYTQDFIESYKFDKRGVVEQVLNLTEEQEVEIVERLLYLYQPQFRNYLYSFLFKNCTTELRDLIYDGLKIDKVPLEKKIGKTHRELIDIYVGKMKWTKVGINLLLGSSLDREISVYESMFLPDNLFEVLGKAENSGGKVVKETIVLNDVNIDPLEGKTPFMLSPVFLFSLLLALMLASLFTSKMVILDKLILGVVSAFGVVLPVIVIITDHVELLGNYNLLWCNPVYLVVLFSLIFKWRKICIVSSITAVAGIALSVVVSISGMQVFETSFYLIFIVLLIALIRTILKCRWQEKQL